MTPELLAKLRAETQQVSRGAHGRTLDLPRGMAARIDAADLRQLLDEHAALFTACGLAEGTLELFADTACCDGEQQHEDNCKVGQTLIAIAKARGGA